MDLVGGAAVEANVDVSFASKRWLAADFLPIERANGYGTLDVSLAYRARRGWSLLAFGRNLTNADVYRGAQEAPYSPGVVVANIGAPRTYGLRAEFKY
jgi:iron complex outermembrane receptor protein